MARPSIRSLDPPGFAQATLTPSGVASTPGMGLRQSRSARQRMQLKRVSALLRKFGHQLGEYAVGPAEADLQRVPSAPHRISAS